MSAACPDRNRGFTLTELAIVLGIAGIAFGGVFAAAQAVWNNYHAYRAAQEVGKVAQNIRESAMGTQGLPAGCGDITGALDASNIFPAEMRRYCPSCSGAAYSYKIDNPFNNQDTNSGGNISAGSFRVLGTSCSGGNAGHFQIVLGFLPQAACIRLLTNAINYNDPEMGVTAMCASSSQAPGSGSAGSCLAGSGWNITLQSNGVWGTSLAAPLNLSEAKTLCSSANGYSEIGWEFKVRD